MSNKQVRVVLGAACFGQKDVIGVATTEDKDVINAIFKEFKNHGHDRIDTARSYGDGTSESVLADVDYQGQGLVVDTKVRSFAPGSHTKDNLAVSIKESLDALKAKKVNIMYLHAPDRATPFAETLEAINEEYKKGLFEKFGLSNFSAEEVEEVVKIAKEKGYVQPTVYQGMYNLLARAGEEALFPILRKHNIGFYAYSPIAGSFLTSKESERFDKSTIVGKIYNDNYMKESFFKAREQFTALGAKLNIGVDELALRWIRNHSLLSATHDDALIIGSKNPANIKKNLDGLDKGPLPLETVEAIDKVWQEVKKDAPKYSF